MVSLPKGVVSAALCAALAALVPQGAAAAADDIASSAAQASGASSAQAGVPRFAPVPPRTPVERSLEHVFAAIGLRDWPKAQALAERTGDPVVAKIVSWSRFSAGGERATFDEVAAFIEAHPDWPRQRAMRETAEEALNDAVPADRVADWFAKYPPVTPKGAMHHAGALLATGRRDDAEKAIRAAWVEHNFPPAVERAFYDRFRRHLTAEDHARRLDRLVWDGRGWEANRMLRRVGAGHAALATARMALRDMKGGVDGAIRRVPDELASDPGLVYERMRWRRRKGRDDDALDALKDIPKTVPRPDLVWTEQHILARRALDAGQVTRAYRLAADHPNTEGEGFAEAEWLAGFIALRFLKEPQTALTHFTRLHEKVNFPVSLARGAYWSGRAAEALGDTETALAWYGRAARHITTFYGQLAVARLDGKGAAPLQGHAIPPEPDIGDAAVAAFAGREVVRAAEIMAASREPDHFRTFVRHLVRLAESPAEHALAARIALAAGRHDVAVWAAKDSLRAGVHLIEAGWPRGPLPRDLRGLEESVLLALMRQESGFNTDAVSWAGARGLMQVMPATARVVARDIGLPFSRERLLEDPDYNLAIGTAYFARVLREFDGSYILALAAYNAGPGRARQWLRRNGDFRTDGVDAIDWIELIPFDETRNYVQRVIENVQVYRAVFNAGRVQVAAPHELGK